MRFLFISSILICLSCVAKVTEESMRDPTKIDFENVKRLDTLISPRDLMEEVEFRVLSTPDSIKLTIAQKIIEFNDRVLVLDKKKNIIFVFDSQGKFLQLVGQKGEGPKEFNEVTDFAVNTQNSKLYIFSRPDFAIFEFDEKFEFSRKIKISDWAIQFDVLESGNFALYSFLVEGDDEYNISIYDISGKLLEKRMKFPRNDNYIPMDFSGFIQKGYYTYPRSSKIFQINEGENYDSLVYEVFFPNRIDEGEIFNYKNFLNFEREEQKSNILNSYEIGSHDEFICYYDFKTATNNGSTLGVRLKGGETFGHLNMKHGAMGKGDVYVKMFFIGPYNIPSYSKKYDAYYVISYIDAVSIYYEEILDDLNSGKVKDAALVEILENTSLEEPILMKFKLKPKL